MTSTPLKILVSGDVNGKLKQFFSRIDTVNKKNGPFEMVFCVGEFFGADSSEWSSYKTGKNKVPIVTYILGPCNNSVEGFYPSSDGCELCPNLVYLGKNGVLTGSSGLKVAYLSGVEENDPEDKLWNFTRNDLNDFIKPLEETGIDILLTSQWPKGVTRFVKTPDDLNSNNVSDVVAQLVLAIKPRYHFSGLEGISYERLPYRNHHILHEKAQHTTRFIALSEVGNQNKAKWLYAFSIVPMIAMSPADLTKQPPDVTECPFIVSAVKAKEIKDETAQQFFYDLNTDSGNRNKRFTGKDEKYHKKRKLNEPLQTGPCWFCLGSAEVEKHLVVSVGEYVYVTIAKGALVPDHVLILPIGHYQSTVDLKEEVLNEVENYKSSLRKYFKSQGKCPIFYERNFKSPHLQIQVVPVDISKASNVKDAFMECANEKSIELDEIPKRTDIKQIVRSGVPYFYAELPTAEKLLHRIRRDFHFPIHFGREVLISDLLLNMPGKEDWKSCKKSMEEEKVMASNFRESFEKYDFTMTE